MKKCFYALMVMLMALVSVSFAACGDDDDEPKVADIVGTWAYDTDILGDFAILFQFTKDGKFHEVQTSIDGGETIANDVFHGTYTVSGHKLIITYIYQFGNETVECTYSVNGDKLTLNLEDANPATFTRVKDSAIEPYL